MELSISPGAGGSISSFADLDTYLGAVADAGFPGVSLGLQQIQPALDEGVGLDQVAKTVTSHGLRCTDVLSMVLRKNDDDAFSAATKLRDAAAATGADYALALIFTRVNDESIARLGRCAEIVAESGARLAVEFVPDSPLSTITEALSLVDHIGANRLGIMIDTWHFFRGGGTWDELEKVPLEAVAFVQFDDALAALSEDIMSETTNRRTWPGLGEFELERFASTLIGRGWSGIVSVEVLSTELRELDLATYTREAYQTTRPFWL
jgi:sugar phosphate isomerase/epimerase